MTPDLSAIRARAEAATPGPWKNQLPGRSYVVRAGNKRIAEMMTFTSEERDNDATFIAHARADIPALLAEIERLQSLLAPLKGESAEMVMRELRRRKGER